MVGLEHKHITQFMKTPHPGLSTLLVASWGGASLVGILSGYLLQGVVTISTMVSIVITFFALLYGYYIWNFLSRQTSPMTEVFLFLFAFMIRLLCMFVLVELFMWDYGAPYFALKDDWAYHNMALGVSQDIPNGEWFNILREIGPYYTGYPYFCGILYYTIYPSTYTARVANVFLGSLLVVLLYRITRYAIQNQRIATCVGALAAVSPAAILYSSIQLKDIPLATMTLTVLLCFFRIHSGRGRWFDYILLPICLLVSLLFRPAMPVILIFLLWCTSIASMRINKRGIAFSTALLIVFMAAWFYVGENVLQNDSLNPLGYVEQRFGNAQTVPTQSALNQADTWFTTFMSFPAFALGSPFVPTFLSVDLPIEDPIPMRMRTDEYNKPSTLMLITLAPFLFTGLVKSLIEYRSNLYLMSCAGFILLHKLMLANSAYILNVRQSTPSILIGLPFVVIGLQAWSHPTYRKITLAAFVINYLIVLAFNYVRLSARGLV